MKTRRLRFRNSRGVELGGRLDVPDEAEPGAYALFSHCFTCNKDYKFIRAVSRALTEHGIAVLCLDFSGLGESGGRFEDTNFTTSVEDVMAAAGFLAASFAPPALLVGHSLGGTVMLAAAAGLSSVRAVATINAPFEASHILHNFSGIIDKIDAEGEAPAVIGGVSYRITRQLIEDLRVQRTPEAIRALGAALLVLHAPADGTVPFDDALKIFAQAPQPKGLVALDGADHLLTRPADADYAGALIAVWAAPYLDRVSAPSAAS